MGKEQAKAELERLRALNAEIKALGIYLDYLRGTALNGSKLSETPKAQRQDADGAFFEKIEQLNELEAKLKRTEQVRDKLLEKLERIPVSSGYIVLNFYYNHGLSIREIARRLYISRAQVYRLLEKGLGDFSKYAS